MAIWDKLKTVNLDDALAELGSEQVDEQQVLGRAVINTFFVLARLVKMHALNNDAFNKPLSSMMRLIDAYAERGSGFTLRVHGDNFFINGNMVKLDNASFGPAQFLVHLYESLGLGSISVATETTDRDIGVFLQRLRDTLALASGERRKKMVDRRFGGIVTRAPEGETDPLMEFKREAQRTYAVIAVAVEEFSELGRENRFPPMRRLKRMVQKLVDLLEKNEPLVVALASAWGGLEHQRMHPVNVTIYALVIARRLGIDRVDRVKLAIGALLHDTGIDDTQSAKERGVDPGAAPECVDLLTRYPALNEDTLLWTVIADEVAMFTGYVGPRPRWYAGNEGPHLYSRIIAVAHHYERLVITDRAKAGSPYQGIVAMVQRGRVDADPIAVKALVAGLGLLPVGSVVELSDGAKAIVVAGHDDPRLCTRPVVRPLKGMNGSHDPEKQIDLAERSDLEVRGPILPKQLAVSVPGEVYA